MASGELAAHDDTTIALATWAAGLKREAIPPAAAHALVWHHLDSFGCAIGAIGAPPCIAVRALAAESATQAGKAGVSVIGLANRVSAEIGAFANASMVRYLDYNDNYLRTGGGHTSDLIATLWALAELRDASGSDLLAGLHAGYETFAALADAVPLRDRGWDYPLFIGIAAAVGGAALLGLNVDQTANAISMAVTPAVPLGITRAGQLSNWKGLASPFSAMTGLLAVRLAARGITGPPRAIEGVRGLWSLVTGEFSVGALGQPAEGLSAAERSAYKLSVAEFNAQGAVGEFVKLHDEGLKPDDIESIRIGTYFIAWSEIGGGQDDHAQKWDPRNRETADHSLPYMCAVALVDGRVQAESYLPDRFLDPALRPLMNKIEVAEDPDITADWTRVPAHDITIRLVSGETRHIRVDYPRGHPGNPATEAELIGKFKAQVEPAVGVRASDDLLAVLSDLDALGTLAPMFGALRVLQPAS
jgi:2-methylcitrate dehydratase